MPDSSGSLVSLQIVAMLCVTLLLAASVIAFSVVLWKAAHMAGANEPAIFSRLFGGGNAVRLLTVALVVACATFLGLAEHLDQGVVSLFAGIAGFVLGGLRTDLGSNGQQSRDGI